MPMTPTLFSVSYAGLWGQARLDLGAFFAKASTLGYPAVELMGKRPHLSILDWPEAALRELAARARDAGVEIATLAGYTDFTGGQATEVPWVEMQIAYVRTLARMAELLGAKIIRVFTGYASAPDAYRRDWDLCVAALRACAQACAEHGVTLGVQNHHDTGVAWETYLELLRAVDHANCRAMFDPWAPALHGDDLRECARALAPIMAQTTLADYVRLRRFAYVPGLVNYRAQEDAALAVPLGDGFVDFQAFFAGLKEGGFSGYVAYEMCSPLRGGGEEASLDATAAASLAYIRRLIG